LANPASSAADAEFLALRRTKLAAPGCFTDVEIRRSPLLSRISAGVVFRIGFRSGFSPCPE
jgi:hypothetical protein